MEEKKLTDEEIVKALEICGKDFECSNCPYVYECCERLDGSAGLLIQALDLIHRLQCEKTELEQRYLEESKERCKFEQLYDRKCHDKNIGIGVQRAYWEKKVQQAEKDTAKEIANWLPTTVNEDKNILSRIIKEHYGVEVE